MRATIRHLILSATIWSCLGGLATAQTAAQTGEVVFALRLRAELQVRNPDQPSRALGPLPLVEERIRTTIDAQHATTELVQVFHNQSGQRLEGQYVLRPSMDARVEGFAYYVGEERIEGEVLERQTARTVYRQVTVRRRDPAILEQTADGEFTFRVFPIEPGENKRVETTMAEWLPRRGGQVTYRVPASARARGEITLRDPRARNVRSSTHAIEVERVEGGLRIRTREARAEGGELILRWDVAEAPFQPTAYVHRDAGNDGYFLLSLAALEGFEDRVSQKDVTLVLDRSGSMSGDAIVHARRAAADIIARLGAEDRVNVIAFDDDVDPLFARPRDISPDVRAEALSYVQRLRPGGGTDIAYALERAFASQHDGGARPRVVIFLTDGQSEPNAALAAAAREQRDVRIFAVGIGNGVNRALLSRLAATKRGTSTFIDRASQIESDVGHLYAQIARPLLVDVSIEIDGAVATRIYPRSVPDLFIDDELVIAGRFRGRGSQLRFTVRGQLRDRAIEMRTTAVPAASGRREWVGRRWAISRVDHLLEEIQLQGEQPELRAEVTSLALAYHFVTPYTAFLAIPERELNAQAAQTLQQGRVQRQQAQRQHADARALTAGGEATAAAPPAPGAFDFGGGGDEAEPMSDGEWGGSEEISEATSDYGGGVAGCASCAVASERGAPRSLLLVPFLIGLLFWRRARR